AENPRDRVAGFRVVQLLPGVGPATAAKVLDEVVAHAGAGNPADTAGAALAVFAPPARAQEDWHPFVKLMASVYGRQTPWPAEFEMVR
ncbi:ATP-dependent helicase, partial [Burkholderia sp. SIMBA_019]